MEATPPKAVANRFPQVGGDRTIEASEVVFDPIQGDKVVETPPPPPPPPQWLLKIVPQSTSRVEVAFVLSEETG